MTGMSCGIVACMLSQKQGSMTDLAPGPVAASPAPASLTHVKINPSDIGKL